MLQDLLNQIDQNIIVFDKKKVLWALCRLMNEQVSVYSNQRLSRLHCLQDFLTHLLSSSQCLAFLGEKKTNFYLEIIEQISITCMNYLIMAVKHIYPTIPGEQMSTIPQFGTHGSTFL
jgi:hypothetical protein